MAIRIGLDFDGTLNDRKDVQEFYHEMKEKYDIEFWIVTARPDKVLSWMPNITPVYWEEVYALAKKLKIPADRVKFMCYENKSEFYKDENFLLHLDDCNIECNYINRESKTIALSVAGNSTYRKKAIRLIEKHLKNVDK